ncbi:hypothetical protein TSAR_015974 [Trichomalopsis sarcophagae]|uniref:C2H2-type domain-containing protein n=1 Tax=Trichomalopsis sarcophagae TaxID=543379 RepID=A0A232FKE4_9HYME|nr:hypothetical protein TSAR_015974 [Trichomalopsis sarcophagae]
MVCASCVGKLDGIHAFATMALRSQERLRQASVDSSDSSDSPLDRGLLHSILTKGSTGTQAQSNDEETIDARQRTPSTEEMEVKVDPMLFLQCALDRPSSADYSDFSDDCSRASEPTEPLSLTANDKSDNEDPVDCNESEYEEDQDSGGESNHVCKICAKSFASQMSLQNHLWSHLPSSVTTTATTTTSSNKTRRLSQDDSSCNGSFLCPICGKKISTKGNLKVHLETHRPKGKYGCDICGRIFKTQSNLFRHKEYHSGVQFPCGVCGRVYPTNSTLRAHSITHSDLRPHACPLCDKTFKRNQDLKFHINQHTGARPYQCPYCPKAFASSGNCFSHRKRMHPKEVHRDRQRAADLMR